YMKRKWRVFWRPISQGSERCEKFVSCETLDSDGREPGHETRGMEVHPEIEKRGLLDIFLHARLRNRMVLTRVRGAAEVFRAKIRLQHAVWVHSAEVDALFRFIRWKGN